MDDQTKPTKLSTAEKEAVDKLVAILKKELLGLNEPRPYQVLSKFGAEWVEHPPADTTNSEVIEKLQEDIRAQEPASSEPQNTQIEETLESARELLKGEIKAEKVPESQRHKLFAKTQQNNFLTLTEKLLTGIANPEVITNLRSDDNPYVPPVLYGALGEIFRIKKLEESLEEMGILTEPATKE